MQHKTNYLCIAAVLLLINPALVLAEDAQITTPSAEAGEQMNTESQDLASEILTRMAEYLGGSQKFSVTVHGNYDAVQDSGEKIEFAENRKIILNRPDQLRVEGESDNGIKTVTIFDGKEITLVDTASNVYAVEPQPGLQTHCPLYEHLRI